MGIKSELLVNKGFLILKYFMNSSKNKHKKTQLLLISFVLYYSKFSYLISYFLKKQGHEIAGYYILA